MKEKVYDWGTDEGRQDAELKTPGQMVDQFVNEGQKEQKEKTKKHFSQVFGNPLKGFPYNEEFMVKDVVTEEAVAELEEDELEEGDADASLKKKAEKTGMPLGVLKQVFKRGVAAWRTGHRPGTNPTQWGHARVNSFVTKSKGTWGGADKDLAQKVRGS